MSMNENIHYQTLGNLNYPIMDTHDDNHHFIYPCKQRAGQNCEIEMTDGSGYQGKTHSHDHDHMYLIMQM